MLSRLGSNAESSSFRRPALERGPPQAPFWDVEPEMHPLRMKRELFLQRLFSAFPDGKPGLGLLFLRLCISVPLFYWGIGDLSAAADAATLVRDGVAAAGGILLVAGLWTPVVAILISLVEAWIGLAHHFAPQGHLLVAALGIAQAMLGPGAWSVDARLFGRRVFEMGDKDV
jgi:putative oxidoreductase